MKKLAVLFALTSSSILEGCSCRRSPPPTTSLTTQKPNTPMLRQVADVPAMLEATRDPGGSYAAPSPDARSSLREAVGLVIRGDVRRAATFANAAGFELLRLEGDGGDAWILREREGARAGAGRLWCDRAARRI